MIWILIAICLTIILFGKGKKSSVINLSPKKPVIPTNPPSQTGAPNPPNPPAGTAPAGGAPATPAAAATQAAAAVTTTPGWLEALLYWLAPIVAGFILFGILSYFVSQDQKTQLLTTTATYTEWGLLTFCLFLLYFTFEKRGPRIAVLAVVGAIVALLVFVQPKKVAPNDTTSQEHFRIQSADYQKPSPTGKESGGDRAWVAHTHSVEQEDPEIAAMAREELADVPDLLAVVTQESDLQHYEQGADGKPDHSKVLRGRVDNKGTLGPAYGVAMINLEANGAFCSEHGKNIMLPRDNLQCAKLIHAEKGIGPWLTDPRIPNKLVFDLPVNKKGVLVKLRLPSPDFVHFDYTVDVPINVSDGGEFILEDPDKDYKHGKPSELEFQMADRPTVAHFTYKILKEKMGRGFHF